MSEGEAEEGVAERLEIEHVIVVMLENRSFDHLLGFTQLPGGPQPGLDEDGNPIAIPLDPADTDAGEVGLSDDGRYVVPLDPGHSHLSVLQQLGVSRSLGGSTGDPDNRGFVRSYLDKAEGRSPELRDRIELRMRVLGTATIAAGLLAFGLRWVGTVWVALLLLFVGVLLALTLRGTHVFAYLPRELLKTVFRKWWLFVLLGVGAIALVGMGSVAGCLCLRAPAAVAIVGVGGFLLWKSISVGTHKTVANPRGVLDPVVMRSFNPADIGPLSELAQNFVTCGRWFCSVPGETWPNRNFAHAGTSDGAVDIEYRLFENETIFELLDQRFSSAAAPAADSAGTETEGGVAPPDNVLPWSIYFSAVPQVLAFPKLWKWIKGSPELPRRFRTLGCLLDDIDKKKLPRYSFVEPHHGAKLPLEPFDPTASGPCADTPIGKLTNSQHPGNNLVDVATYSESTSATEGRDFVDGMELVAEIYERLRDRRQMFEKTVLLITYDEHGGFFDHVCPPTDAIPPGPAPRGLGRWLLRWIYGVASDSFHFRLLGPRVPAILVNPLLAPGYVTDVQFDHASIPRSIRDLFSIDTPLTEREGTASSFAGLLTSSRGDAALPDLSGWLSERSLQRSQQPPEAEPPDDNFVRSLEYLTYVIDAFVEDEATKTRLRARIDRLLPGDEDERAQRRAARRARSMYVKARGRVEARADEARDIQGRVGATSVLLNALAAGVDADELMREQPPT